MQKALTKHKGQMMINKLKSMQFKRAAAKLINVKNALLAGLTLLASNCYAASDVLGGAWSSVTANFGTSSVIYALAIVADAGYAYLKYQKDKHWVSLISPAIIMIAATVFWTIAPSPGG